MLEILIARRHSTRLQQRFSCLAINNHGILARWNIAQQ
jgi:hypothetical protein